MSATAKARHKAIGFDQERIKAMARKNTIDLKGKKFGNLLVLKRGPTRITTKAGDTAILWWTRCDCGRKKLILGASLRNGASASCGCRIGTRKHGLCANGERTPEYALWLGAKKRAKDAGIEFNIKIKDVVIPSKCPIFGFRLVPSKGKPGCRDNSPSLDRLVNTIGYTRKNVWVISGRANRAKSNLSLKELEILVKTLRRKLRSIQC